MSYRSLIKKLYEINLKHPVKLDLENIKRLYDAIDRPLDRIPVVHVGGTNGKGSVCWKIVECLRQRGLKTGLFTSPHISSFRERIQVNGKAMDEDDVLSSLPMLFELCESKNIPATFFELTTALAMTTFAKAKCDAVVLEVGLGGRLDATNILTRPVLSMITSVQLDHMHILGDTVEKIAVEKAGIMKDGVPVLVGPDVPIDVLRSEARRYNAKLFTLPDVLAHDEREQVSAQRYYSAGCKAALQLNHSDIMPGIFSDRNAEVINVNLAKAAMKLLDQSGLILSKNGSIYSNDRSSGLFVRPPCRFEIVPFKGATGREVDVVLDIAHNYDGMRNLVDTFQTVYGIDPQRDVRVVLGMSADKDVDSSIELVMQLVRWDASRVYCAQAKHPRAISKQDLQRKICSIARNKNHFSADAIEDHLPADVSSNLRKAISDSAASPVSKNRPVIVVCGSAFIMAEARAALGIVEPRDGEITSDSSASSSVQSAMSNFSDSQESFGEKTKRWN